MRVTEASAGCPAPELRKNPIRPPARTPGLEAMPGFPHAVWGMAGSTEVIPHGPDRLFLASGAPEAPGFSKDRLAAFLAHRSVTQGSRLGRGALGAVEQSLAKQGLLVSRQRPLTSANPSEPLPRERGSLRRACRVLRDACHVRGGLALWVSLSSEGQPGRPGQALPAFNVDRFIRL